MLQQIVSQLEQIKILHVPVLNLGSSLGLIPDCGHCIMFSGKTIYILAVCLLHCVNVV